MSFRDNEWTILEKLLLSQAVYQHGEHSWLQVSSTLKQHALIQHRQSDFFDHKNCSLQYDLLVENLISEKDTSIVVQLAKDLYTQRIEEIKNALVHGEQEVGALVSEIDLIRKGELDDKIRGEYQTKPRPQEKISEQVENLEIMHEEWTEDVVMGEQEENSSMKEEWAKIMEQDVQENQDMEPMQIEEEKVEEREACGMERMEADVKERSQVKDREDMMRTEVMKEEVIREEMMRNEEMRQEAIRQESTREESTREESTREESTREESTREESTREESTMPSVTLKFDTEIEVISNSNSNNSKPRDIPTITVEPFTKEENQRQKSWQKSVQILWQEISNHKSGPLFLNPIKKARAPLYNKIVKRPLDLKVIKNKVREGVIKSTVEFERDIVLMLTNALMYNKEGTETYLLALEMLQDVKDQIELFKFANSFLKRKMV